MSFYVKCDRCGASAPMTYPTYVSATTVTVPLGSTFVLPAGPHLPQGWQRLSTMDPHDDDKRHTSLICDECDGSLLNWFGGSNA